MGKIVQVQESAKSSLESVLRAIETRDMELYAIAMRNLFQAISLLDRHFQSLKEKL